MRAQVLSGYFLARLSENARREPIHIFISNYRIFSRILGSLSSVTAVHVPHAGNGRTRYVSPSKLYRDELRMWERIVKSKLAPPALCKSASARDAAGLLVGDARAELTPPGEVICGPLTPLAELVSFDAPGGDLDFDAALLTDIPVLN